MTLSLNNRSSARTLRRARPLLGTFVEITATGRSGDNLPAAIDRAFAVIGRVQRLMSFHDPRSEVAQLNRQAERRAVRVSAWTWQVLLAAQRLHRETSGAFDITIAPLLQEWGFLPRDPRDGEVGPCPGGAEDIELLPGQRVRFRRPLRIDLGGIAKGFAVDQAVEELRASGVPAGVVNAGGDLRVFGSLRQPVHVRHPARPGVTIPLRPLAEAALATSATYFSRRIVGHRRVSPLVDAARGRACLRGVSVSVQAPTCLVADALTKVLFAQGRKAAPLVRGFGATAFIVNRRGEVFSTHPPDEA